MALSFLAWIQLEKLDLQRLCCSSIVVGTINYVLVFIRLNGNEVVKLTTVRFHPGGNWTEKAEKKDHCAFLWIFPWNTLNHKQNLSSCDYYSFMHLLNRLGKGKFIDSTNVLTVYSAEEKSDSRKKTSK